MKILLTGGAGYIGSHTAAALLDAGYNVVIADNFANSSPRVISRLQRLCGKTFPVYAADVCDADSAEQIFAEQQPDAVIHFAGLKAVGESVAEPLRYYRNNLDAALTVLEAMARYGCGAFIFSSSATVYGGQNISPLTEDMPCSCTNPYGRGKRMIEQILADYAGAESGFSVMLLRYFNPVGAHKSGLLGDDPQGKPNNLFPYITRVAAGLLDYLPVFGNDYPTRDGTGVRDYIHVADLAEGHVAAMEYALAHPGAETVNLGAGRGYSVLEMVGTFERVNQVAVPYQIVARRAGDVAECYANPEKAARLLGWRAKRDLDDMCRDAWRWQQFCAGDQDGD